MLRLLNCYRAHISTQHVSKQPLTTAIPIAVILLDEYW